MDYSKLTDEELINLLFNEEDRLPRTAVDEFVRRAGRMVKPLADIVGNNFNWMRDIPEWWAAIHSVFIIGTIGTEETVVPLLKSLRFACAQDCDWVTEQLPAIFSKVGIKAIEGLKTIAVDCTTDWFTKTIAMESLAAITITNPETEKDIFAFIGIIFCNESEDKDIKAQAGHILLDFQKEEFKDSLFSFVKEERKLKDNDYFYCLEFDDDDVRQAFNSSEKNLQSYQKDWLSFYDEDEIRQRQERWKEEDEEVGEEDESSLHSDNTPFVRNSSKIGRNEPCPCGNGKKYKKCCGK